MNGYYIKAAFIGGLLGWTILASLHQHIAGPGWIIPAVWSFDSDTMARISDLRFQADCLRILHVLLVHGYVYMSVSTLAFCGIAWFLKQCSDQTEHLILRAALWAVKFSVIVFAVGFLAGFLYDLQLESGMQAGMAFVLWTIYFGVLPVLVLLRSLLYAFESAVLETTKERNGNRKI